MLVEFPEFTRELDELYQSTSKKILTTDIEIKSNSQHLRKLGLKINQTSLPVHVQTLQRKVTFLPQSQE